MRAAVVVAVVNPLRKRPPAWLAAVLAGAVAVSGTAFANVSGSSAHHSKPTGHKRHTAPACSSACIRKLADAEIHRLAPLLYVGRADYAATANVSNHAALADQATGANSATSAGSATTASSAGSAALSKVDYATSTRQFSSGVVLSLTASCPSGDQIVGGGARVSDTSSDSVIDSWPRGSNNQWQADATGGSGDTLTVTAICAPVAGAP